MGRAPALSRSTFAVRGVNAFWKEITIGLRLLSKAPRLTAGVVLILAIGIASNTVIFSVAHGIFLRPLSYPDIGRLVYVSQAYPGFPEGGGQFRLSHLSRCSATEQLFRCTCCLPNQRSVVAGRRDVRMLDSRAPGHAF
jgi:hypothetical protein